MRSVLESFLRSEFQIGRKRAECLGLDRMTMDEIDAEIAAARAERRNVISAG